MPFDVNGNPIKVLTKEYVNEIIDFLSDGTNKILKTSDGDAWCVSIDSGIQITFDGHFVGSSKIKFNWTEIDEIPDIIEDNRKEKKLIGKTIISNGTYYASRDLVDGYNEVFVGVPIIANVTVSGHKLVVTHSGIFDPSVIEEDNTPEISNSAEQLISKTITSNGTYNPVLDKLEVMNEALGRIAVKYGVGIAQIPVAWAIAKGTLPIIGVTKVSHIEDAVKA
jgi:hypothetical protein